MAISREDIKKKLGENATDEQITSMLDLFHDSEENLKKEKTDLQTQLSKLSDYDDIKAKLKEIEKASMTEQQRLEEEKKEVAKNLRESKMIKNEAQARKILAETNITDSLLSRLIDEDETTTINNANEYLNSYNALKEQIAKTTKEDLLKINVKPNTDNKVLDTGMTFEKFRTLSQEEQNRFAKEHPEEFKKL